MTETKSRHVSGTFLKDHCGVVLDSKIAVGDAELSIDGIDGIDSTTTSTRPSPPPPPS